MTVSLVTNFGMLAHLDSCYTVRRARGMRGLAPVIERSEVIDFLRARRFDACGGCLRSERDQLAAERLNNGLDRAPLALAGGERVSASRVGTQEQKRLQDTPAPVLPIMVARGIKVEGTA